MGIIRGLINVVRTSRMHDMLHNLKGGSKYSGGWLGLTMEGSDHIPPRYTVMIWVQFDNMTQEGYRGIQKKLKDAIA